MASASKTSKKKFWTHSISIKHDSLTMSWLRMEEFLWTCQHFQLFLIRRNEKKWTIFTWKFIQVIEKCTKCNQNVAKPFRCFFYFRQQIFVFRFVSFYTPSSNDEHETEKKMQIKLN